MKARVHVTFKNGVLDPQGKAIGLTLANLGFEGVVEVRQGRKRWNCFRSQWNC